MTSDASPDNPDTQYESLSIPRASFTAFRLMYAPANEISELAKCVFLGRIPDLWWIGEKTGLLGRLALKIKSQVRSTLDHTTQLFNDIIRGEADPRGIEAMEASWREEIEFQVRYNRTTEMALRNLYWHVLQLKENDSDDESDDESDNDNCESSNYSMNSFPESNAAYQPTGAQKIETNSSLLYPQSPETGSPSSFVQVTTYHQDQECLNSKHTTLSKRIEHSPHLSPISELHLAPKPKVTASPQNTLAQSSQRSLLILERSYNENKTPLFNITPSQTRLVLSADTEPQVMFNAEGEPKRRSKVSFAHPIPEENAVGSMLHKEYVKGDKKHFKRIHRLHNLASRSKRKAIKTGFKVKGKVTLSFLKKYNVGDILRVDRMLAIINKEGLANASASSNSSRTENRLNEYYVVLQRGPSLDNPLVVQLYRPELYGDFSGKPDHKIKLRRGDSIELYSNVEKSFKVTETRDDYLKVFIFIPRFSKLCFMWMFLVQTILGDTYVPVISVHIENTDVSINIPISGDLFPEESGIYNKELELSLLNEGYRVKYDFVIEHLLKSIKNVLCGMEFNHKDIKEWVTCSNDMWLCFKFFDRLEWIWNDTDLFLIQHHIQRTSSQLEVRQRRRTPLSITTRDHKLYSRPYPIEGFLSRITNTSGEEYSNLRAFYKIQYIHTADNLLFFSKLLQALPPSPGNILQEADISVEELNMPEIFIRSPFQTDEKGHIPWLNSPDFEKFDREAMGEFTRRVQQVTKATAMVDLCTVKEVIPLKFQEILKQHLYFQSFFWHSSSVIINDESLIDSGFELVLLNGGRLKLLAPSRFIRDQWIERLTSLVEYWRAKKTADIVRQVQVREENMKKFEVKEHIDSNATHELQDYFSLSSAPNDFLFDSSSLSMPTNLIKNGYVFNKLRKHTDFNQRFLVLCPGYLIIFTLFKRSKATGIWKQTPCFERYMTLPLSVCYIYSGELTSQDLLDKNDSHAPGQDYLSRFYADGWRSSEEDSERCFSIWFGKKRMLRHSTKSDAEIGLGKKSNPGLITMIRKLGFTGKKMTFLCRSRQERESWAHAISSEIDRLAAQ